MHIKNSTIRVQATQKEDNYMPTGGAVVYLHVSRARSHEINPHRFTFSVLGDKSLWLTLINKRDDECVFLVIEAPGYISPSQVM